MTNDAIIKIPKKNFFQCEINFLKLSTKWQNIMKPFYRLFQSEVYAWKETNFTVPQSVFTRFNLKKVELGITNCLNVDECIQLSRDANGNRIPLSKEQLCDLQTLGEIRVKSLQFPGKNHVWRVNRLLQKGSHETYLDFKKDWSRVARLIVITLTNRIKAKKLSMLSSVRHIWKGIYLFLDLLFGIPHNNPGNINTKMEEECLQFLTCELNITKSDHEKLTHFWDYLEKLSCIPKQCGADILKEMDTKAIPAGIYQFTSPNRLCIDLRLMHKKLESRCYDIVQDCINDIEQSNWFLEYKNSYVERVYHESLSLENIEKNILHEGMKAKTNKIFHLIKSRCEKEFIPDSICDLMIQNAKFYIICSDTAEHFKRLWLEFKYERLEIIRKKHPYLCMISSWMRKQLKRAAAEFLEKHRFTQLKMVIDKCSSEQLLQHEYFIKRYLLFQKERRQLIYHELVTNSSFPDRSYNYRSHMALSSYWKITPSLTNLGKKCYQVNKYKSVSWTTQYPLWRWVNYVLRTYMLMLTIGQLLLIKLPLGSQVSYLALFRKKPFVAQQTFNSDTGSVSPSVCSKPTPTLYSRLSNLWTNVWKSRNTFESAVFTGLLDKSVVRHFHRFWVIGMKGVMGTIGLVTIMPVLCLLTSSFSVIFGILVPIWVPFVTLVIFVISIFFYDLESPNCRKNRIMCFFQAILWHILWCGLLQLCCQIMMVVIILPILVLFALLLIVLRFLMRFAWDLFIFHLILKRHAHVPAANDFITKRVSGPGLAYEYEILVLPEHVLTGLRCLMEKLELELWLKQVSKIIRKPLENYKLFVDKTLHPLNVSLNQFNANICRLYEKETEALDAVTRDYHKRIKMLNISPFVNKSKKEKLHMSLKNLQIVLEKSEKLWQQFYTEHLQPRMKQLEMNEDSWWNNQNIRSHDMKNLSLSNLSYLFGDQILTPIEECDEVFQLETNELTMKTYIEMFVKEDYQEDFDKINIVQSNCNKGVSMEYCQFKLRHLLLPHFSISDCFSRNNFILPSALESFPDKEYYNISRFQWIKKGFKWMKGKGKGCEDTFLDAEIAEYGGSKEIMNMKLYHPVIICTLLHLRDRDNAMVQLDHRAVQEGIDNCINISYDQDFLENTNLTITQTIH